MHQYHRKGESMALNRAVKERTVAFFEIVASERGEQHRIEQLPWDDTLSAIALTKDVNDRTFESESTFIGNSITIDMEDHLLLHRVKNPGEWLSVLNWDTGEWRELESRAKEGYLDTSAICFLPYGNIVGIMQGSTSAR